MSINIKQLPDASAGLEGTDGNTGSFIFVNIPYNTTSPLTLSSAILPRRCVVQSVQFVPDVVATNAVTFSVYSAASGTALGSGTLLHSGTGNLQATANTNASLTLLTTGVTNVALGSRVGVVISGALGASGSGVITIALTPA